MLSFAVRYALETSDANTPRGSLEVEEFLATEGKNSYEIPWILVRPASLSLNDSR